MNANLPTRVIRVAVATSVVAASALMLSTHATAAPAGNGVFIACGYGDTIGDQPVDCPSLPTALADAVAFSNQYASGATVELMPGSYCPIVIPYDSRALTLVGIGLAGIDTSSGPEDYTPPEAGLTTITYDSAHCDDTTSYAVSNTTSGSQFIGTITLENLAVSGASAGGPSSGIDITNTTLRLRDVAAENFTNGSGLYALNDLNIENSSFVNNQVGATAYDTGSLDESTFAGNSSTGLLAEGDLYLDNDTIAHNGNGIYVQGFGNAIQMANSIIGDNATDCAGTTGDLEPNGGPGGNGDNLIGSTCNTGNNSGDTPDIAFPSDATIAALDTSGITPYISPPALAIGAAESGWCGSTGTDQLEDTYSGGQQCDIGSINTTSGITTPNVAPGVSPMAFGDVPINEPATVSTGLANTGGGLVGVSGLSITGDSQFTLSTDGCTYTLLFNAQGSSCYLSVSAAPDAVGTTITGTLVVHLVGASDLDVPLSATGAPPVSAPGSPTGLHGTAGKRQVTLSWTAPTDDGGEPIQSYDIEYSANSGSTWSDWGTFYDTSGTVYGLTNGTPYVFEVSANNGFASGPESAISAPLTPHTSTDVLALSAVHATTIKEGASASVATTLSDKTAHSGVAGVMVHLLKRAAGASGPFTAAGSAKTNGHGQATISVHPKTNTAYEFAFNGNGTYAAAPNSSSGVVSVAQRVTASLSASTVAHGHAISVFGTVSPNESGKSVVLEELKSGKWVSLGISARIKNQRLPGSSAKTLGYVLSYAPAASGHEKLRVTRAKTAVNAAGGSHTLSLKVT